MKKHEIVEGRCYTAKVSGNLVTVQVNRLRRTTDGPPRYATRIIYDVTNLATGRRITFRSAAKFRSEVVAERTKVEVE